jgi:release factor glutamine methyltransferase
MAVNLQTIKEIRNYLKEELADIYQAGEIKSITNIVILSILRTDRVHLLCEKDKPLLPGQSELITRICRELKSGKPIQYILGETTFYGCKIKVNGHVLIPRPETEELVDLIVKENPMFTGNILDIGTGSGCVAIALAVNLPLSKITGTDVSEKALATASENAIINNVRIRFLKDDIRDTDFPATENTGIIVSNPPYVLNSEKQRMHINVLNFEPDEALFVPDDDPLRYFRAILNRADRILIRGGSVYFEINETMGKSMLELLESYRYSGLRIFKDINGKDRMMKGTKND